MKERQQQLDQQQERYNNDSWTNNDFFAKPSVANSEGSNSELAPRL